MECGSVQGSFIGCEWLDEWLGRRTSCIGARSSWCVLAHGWYFDNAGMAGDRGMRYPELTGAALQHLQTNGCTDGYSTSRTCEISLSNHSGINFRGLVYLADEASKPKQQQQSA